MLDARRPAHARKTPPSITEGTESKWDLIPDAWKQNVDESLMSVLTSNRSHTCNTDTLRDLSPVEFLNKIESAWENHNQFYRSIRTLARDLSMPLAPHNAEMLRQVLRDMEKVDLTTLAYSLAIKPHLEQWSSIRNIVVQPSKIFHIEYVADHAAMQQGLVSSDAIMHRYHGGSAALMRQRVQKSPLIAIDPSIMDVSKRMKHDAIYNSIDRHPYTKALAEISRIDNFDEYKHLYNLEGIEGFKIHDWLSSHGIAVDGYKTSTAAEKIVVQTEEYLPRLPQYRQTVADSCTAAATMMLLHQLKGAPASQARELEAYLATRSAYLPGGSFAKVALWLARHHPSLEVTILHETSDLFRNVEEVAGKQGLLALNEYREDLQNATTAGVTAVTAPRSAMLEHMSSTVRAGGAYLLATLSMSRDLHTYLISGYTARKYRVYDPLSGSVKFAAADKIHGWNNTPIGAWGIAVRPSAKEYELAAHWFRQEHASLQYGGVL